MNGNLGRDHSPDSIPVVPDHQLLRRIGDGSYGEVWLARSVTGAVRAVKIVRQRFFDNHRPYEREFEGLLHFEPLSRGHEGLVDILQVGRSAAGESFYCVMELADDANAIAGRRGGDAPSPKVAATPASRANQLQIKAGRMTAGDEASPPPSATEASQPHKPLRQRETNWETYQPLTLESLVRQNQGRLPAGQAVAIAHPLAEALAYLHAAGLVHRDIKPSNIIFVGGVPKLADVGLVTRSNRALTYVGTEGFVPPEGPGQPQADIFSLGKCIYEMAMGLDRQEFPSPPSDLDKLPDRHELLELNEIITRACHPETASRYASATALAQDLRLLQQGGSIRAVAPA